MRKIICIGRSFGSMGEDVIPEISQMLGIRYFDKTLLDQAVENSHFPREILTAADERAINAWELSLEGKPANDVLYELQKELILDYASKENCIFIGRCADRILKGRPGYHVFSVFITAPLEYRVEAVMKKEHLTERQALIRVNKMDKVRKSYYGFYTGRDWGRPENYDMTLNIEALGNKKIASIITEIYEKM